MKLKKPIKVLVADDHTIVRRGLISLLSLNTKYEVVGEAANGRQAVDYVIAKEPDVVLMDIQMPIINGLEATHEIKTKLPQVKVLVLSAYDSPEYVAKILESGANGYLLKTTSSDELYSAIDAVYAGYAFFSPRVSKIILEKYLNTLQPIPANKEIKKTREVYRGPLSEREREILQHIVQGETHQQIADILHISVRTVDTHRNNIIKKTNLHDTASLVKYAIKEGLVELS